MAPAESSPQTSAFIERDSSPAASGGGSERAARLSKGGGSDRSARLSTRGDLPTTSTSFRYVKGHKTEIENSPSDRDGLIGIFIHPLNLLLVCLPAGVAAYFLDWGPSYVFWFNFFAMVPLAKILGDATEELAASLKNDMLAGLLNATFGNAVEMVITVQTLRAGLYPVVKATLLGSVLSNTLLVLGMSFFCGGIWTLKEKSHGSPSEAPSEAPGNYKLVDGDAPPTSTPVDSGDGRDTPNVSTDVPPEGLETDVNAEFSEQEASAHMADGFNVNEKVQCFAKLGALVNTSMLLISCMSFSLITVFRSVTYKQAGPSYQDDILLPVSRISSIILMMGYVAYILFQLVTHKEAMSDAGPDDEDEVANITARTSLIVLFSTTIIVACCSQLLVGAIESVTEHTNLTQHFIGIILLPIVGNACEHAAAVSFAMRDKLGLSVSIAVGSSTQIALFVVPFSVIMGWILDRPMDLDFGCLNTSMITMSVVVVLSMVVDGQSNWLQGYLLMSVYAIIAVMYAYLPDEMHDGTD